VEELGVEVHNIPDSYFIGKLNSRINLAGLNVKNFAWTLG